MRQLLTILFATFLLVNLCTGQTSIQVTFPDSLKKFAPYFSPYVISGVSPNVIGILRVGEPFDSTRSATTGKYFSDSEQYLDTSENSYAEKKVAQNGLKILVDTLQEIVQQHYFSKTYKYDSMYASPRYLSIVTSKGKAKMSLKNDKTLKLAAMPVYILNTTQEDKSIYGQNFHINIVQEVLDPTGNWRDIEMYLPYSCSASWGCKKLPPNHMIVTSVLKYGGDYKTLARIRFDNGDILYSDTFSITVNPKIFSDRVRTTLLDGSIMEIQ